MWRAMLGRMVLATATGFVATGLLLTLGGEWPTPLGRLQAAVAATPSGAPIKMIANAPSMTLGRPARHDSWLARTVVDMSTQGRPYPGDTVGLVTFRGNPTRTFHGTGPIAGDMAVAWRYPDRAMCAESTVGEETKTWCGAGWTGQAAVVEHQGAPWVIFGAYDRAVHFVHAETGEDLLAPFATGDIIKGSVTVDPDGFPIVYSGSRDGRYRAIAFDGDVPRELWSLSAADATGPTRWNDDWDGSGLVSDGRLVIGGENSRVFVVELHRSYDTAGMATMDPEVVWDRAGFDEELLAAVGDGNVSIEGSVAMHDGVVYFANSGGLVQGYDLGPLDVGWQPEPVFRYWTGDDTDATIVVDDEGMLYVASEWERFNDRGAESGQVVKLDPTRRDDPVVWSFHDPRAQQGRVAGVWATPALHGDVVIIATTGGTLFGLDRADGTIVWQMEFGDHLWSSPVVVDDVLIQGDCAGRLHAFDLSADGPPTPRWQISLDGCIEATPAVWDGRIHVATRAGWLWSLTPHPDD